MQKTKDILKEVRKLEFRTKNLVDGLISGAYHSVFRGRGIEFSEVREYVPGDDVRTIDWNVTARMNEPYVKEYIEERDLTIYIVFDISASGEFGNIRSKKQTALEIAASFMFSALRNNDNISLVLFSEDIEKYFPPKKGKRHVLRLVREMIYTEPEKKGTNITDTLKALSRLIHKRSIIFLISDFMSKDDFSKGLKILKKRNDVISIVLQDDVERDFPDIGLVELEDEETGEQMLVDTSDEQFRKNYVNIVKDHYDNITKILKKLKVDSVMVDTGKSFELPLRKFFRYREKMINR
ncbi:MAG: DUF58 domain-containing protein [Candidatus Woesearchaeota archaeon]